MYKVHLEMISALPEIEEEAEQYEDEKHDEEVVESEEASVEEKVVKDPFATTTFSPEIFQLCCNWFI